MNGFVDFKEEQRLLDEAELSRVKRPALSAVATGTAKTQPKAPVGEPSWDEGETRVGTDNEGEFILENHGIQQSRAAGKQTKLIVAFAITVIGIGGVGYFKFLRPTAKYNSVELSGTTEKKSAPVEPVFNPLAPAKGATTATSEPVKPAETTITELAAPDSHSTSVSTTNKAVVEPTEPNKDAVDLQAAEIQQLRVDLNNLEVTVNKLQERFALAAAPKPAPVNAPRIERKPIQVLNPNAVTKAPIQPAKPVTKSPVVATGAPVGTRDDSSPTVLGVDIWDGKPSVVVGTANHNGKTSYKVFAAGDRVDGMELRQADPISGTVVFNVSGNNVRVKADNPSDISKGVQNIPTGTQQP
jgi:hypothetical protein